jgi:integrase
MVGAKQKALFLRSPHEPMRYSDAYDCFRQIAKAVGIPHNPAGRRGPAWHSLRHTFAVRRLLLWYRAGSDVHALLPHLAVYLGHLGPAQTYHYLTAAPELLTAAASRFEVYADTGAEQ